MPNYVISSPTPSNFTIESSPPLEINIENHSGERGVDGEDTAKSAVTVGLAGSNADYIVDGNNNFATQLVAARAEAVSSGYRFVHILPGEFELSSQVQFDDNRVRIKGSGKNVTVIKRTATNSSTTMYIGNSTGTSLRENVVIEDITFDYNSSGSGFLLGISWCKNVEMRRCSFKNPSTTAKSLLLMGKFSNGSAEYEARNFLVEDCDFDFGGIEYAWEGIGLIYARDVRFVNCTLKDKPVTPALLNYQSELVQIVNSSVVDAWVSESGLSPTIISSCVFTNAYVKYWGSNHDLNTNNLYWGVGDTTGKTIGIKIQGNRYVEGGSENPYYMGSGDFTLPYNWECEGIEISHNKFINCSTNAISGTVDVDGDSSVLAVKSVDITNNEFDNTARSAINIAGRIINISGNTFKNSNVLTGASSAYHIRVSGEYVRIDNNHFSSSDDILYDIAFDLDSYTDYYSEMGVWLGHNKFSDVSRNTVADMVFYDGVGYVRTPTSGVKVNRQGNQRIFRPKDFGAIGDGETDNSEAYSRMYEAIYANNGGEIEEDIGQYVFEDAIYIRNNKNEGNPQQPPVIISGLSNFNGEWQNIPLTGTVYIMKYTGDDDKHYAKFNTYGTGYLRVKGVTFTSNRPSDVSDDGDNYRMFFAGMTTVFMSECQFYGNKFNNLNTVVQDAIHLGYPGLDGIFGLSDTVDGIGNKMNFQGYGSHYRDIQFHKIRRIISFGNDCNAVRVTNMTTSRSCGTDDLVHGAPFYFYAADRHGASGNIIDGGTIEIKGYPYMAQLGEPVWTPEEYQPEPYAPTATLQQMGDADYTASAWSTHDAIFLEIGKSGDTTATLTATRTLTLPACSGNGGKIFLMKRIDDGCAPVISDSPYGGGAGLIEIATHGSDTIEWATITPTTLGEGTMNRQSRLLALQVNDDENGYIQIDARSGTYKYNTFRDVGCYDDDGLTRGFVYFSHSASNNFVIGGFMSGQVGTYTRDPADEYGFGADSGIYGLLSGEGRGNSNQCISYNSYFPTTFTNDVKFATAIIRTVSTTSDEDTNGTNLDINTGTGSNAVRITASSLVLISGDSTPTTVSTWVVSETTGLTITGKVRIYTLHKGPTSINATSSISIDFGTYNYVKVALPVNVTTVTYTEPTGDCDLTLKLEQTSGGSHTFVFPINSVFPGGVAPTLSTTNGAEDLFMGHYDISKNKYYWMPYLDMK